MAEKDFQGRLNVEEKKGSIRGGARGCRASRMGNMYIRSLSLGAAHR